MLQFKLTQTKTGGATHPGAEGTHLAVDRIGVGFV